MTAQLCALCGETVYTGAAFHHQCAARLNREFNERAWIKAAVVVSLLSCAVIWICVQAYRRGLL